MARFRDAEPEWEILLDLDAVAEREGEDWVWSGPASRAGSARVILSLSRGGGDAVVMREFDVEARDFVAGGFELPEAKGGCDWIDDDTLLLQSSYGAGMATRAGYARTIRRWRRGAAVEAADVLFETSAESELGLWATVDRTAAAPRIWYIDRPSFFEAIFHLGDADGPKTTLDLPTDIEAEFFGDWVAVTRRSVWRIGETEHAPGALLVARLSELERGAARFTPVFEPKARRSLSSFVWAGERLIVSLLDELRPVFECWRPGDQGWSCVELPAGSPNGVAYAWPFDRHEETSDGALLVNSEDPTTPATLALIDAAAETPSAPVVLKRAPAMFDAGGLVVTRHEAVSSDGVRIPYTQTGPAEASGDAPVHLTGYGGFEVSELPRYDVAVGKLWLERGGVSVTAHIRGGGEFGPNWHEAGRRAGKRLAHDDFAAVAADLVARGVTVPGRIAAEGGSNGGLLIANMLTRFPERFGALFCTIPLIDMRRYTKLLAGASWMAEYGDPDDPADWAFIQGFSAYHGAAAGRDYPPILIATTRRDDRVHPGHARKFAAKLQELGSEAYLYEPAAGGHGYGKDSKERAAFIALGLRFLREKIGWR